MGKRGRPRVNVDVLEIMRLRTEGLSWPQIAARTKLGRGTVYRAVTAYLETIKPSQNSALRNVGGRRRRDGTPAKRQVKVE
jgi:transposase